MRRAAVISGVIVLFGVAFVSSPSTHSPYIKFHVGPVERLLGQHTSDEASAAGPPGWGYVPRVLHDREVTAMLRVRDAADVRRLRAELVRAALGRRTTALPTVTPVADARFADLPNLGRMESLTTSMDDGVDSVAYAFYPRRWNRRLFIFNAGHQQDFFHYRGLLGFFLQHRFAVAALAMPLAGLNSKPSMKLEGKSVRVSSHDELECLSHPAHFFVEPVERTLNYLERKLHPRSVTMAGVSGGGATTLLTSLLDPRLDGVYVVAGYDPSRWVRARLAGKAPPAPRRTPGSVCRLGHWDGFRAVSRLANPLDLLLLAGYGRRLVLVFNEFDPCCFPGRGYELYDRPVEERARQLGKDSFDVILDAGSHRHWLSPWARRQVLEDMRKSFS